MGTSKRNLSNDIKKILRQKPLSDINETAPLVSKEILKLPALSRAFDEEETIEQSIRVISNQFISLQSNGFKGKSRKEIIDDPLTQEDFIEMIIEEIEHSTIINSTILERALKIVMSLFLLSDKEFDVYSFAHLLFYEIIKQILLGGLRDNLKDIYEELPSKKIEKMVKNATDEIVNTAIHEKVNQFVDKKISLKNVLTEIIIQTSSATFGEF